MPLFVDGEKLNVKNPPEHLKPYVQEFNEFKKYAQRLNKLQFIRKRTYIERDQNGVDVHLVAPLLIQYVSNIYDPNTETMVEWRYSPSIPPKTNDGDYKFENVQQAEWYRTKRFSIQDPELAFFLYKKSKASTKYKEIELEDIEKEAEQYVESQSRLSSLKYFLYDESSPINLNEKALKTIARAWGINNVDNLSKDRIKIDLENKITVGEKSGGKGIDEFRRMLQLDKKTKVRSFVQQAKENGYIIYSERDKGYFYTNADLDPSEKIVTIHPGEGDVDDILANFLISDDQILKQFMNVCHIKDSVELSEEATEGEDNLDQMGRRELITKVKNIREELESKGEDMSEVTDVGKWKNEELKSFIRQQTNS